MHLPRLSLALCLLWSLGCKHTCEDTVDYLVRCGVEVGGGRVACEDPWLACWTSCYDLLSCDEVPDVLLGDDPLPYEVRECGARCSEPVRCDDGERLPYASMECDGARDCADGSDEEGCP